MTTPAECRSPYLDALELAAFTGSVASTEWPTALRFLRAASRVVDRYTKRFYFQFEAQYLDLDVAPGQREFLTGWDLISTPTQLLVDTALDGTYADDITTDARILTLGRNAPYYGFELRESPALVVGQKSLRVKADWGSPRIAVASGQVLNGATLAGAVTLTVAASAVFYPGQVIRIDSEQMYVTDRPSATTVTVEPGANGTTAAAHANAAAISILRYEDAIAQATGIVASRFWKRRDTAFAAVISDSGPTIEPSGLIDRDLARVLAPYRKRTIA